jgi:pimeloyl-ACP methyl ester carboxylesterase
MVTMPDIELSAGTIAYEDTGGDGPVAVLVHGLVMDNSVWRDVIADLRRDFRCVAPTLPLGSHRTPMRPDADLSPVGQAKLLTEFIEKLRLENVTLVQNDIGLGQLVAGDRPRWLEKLVLVATEAFENYPPGLPGKLVGVAGTSARRLKFFVDPLRFRPAQLLFSAFMAEKPIPRELVDRWFEPLWTDPLIRRDFVRFCAGVRPDIMRKAAVRLENYDGPALVVWAANDRMMPADHGPRLAKLLNAPLIVVPDSRTLVPLDQPAALTTAIRDYFSLTDSRLGGAELEGSPFLTDSRIARP